MFENIIFDLDNTLCECSKYYNDAYIKFGKLQAQRVEYSEDFCIELVKIIDNQFTKTKDRHAFSKHRFPASFQAASLTIDTMIGNELNYEFANKSKKIAEDVFWQKYELYDGVHELLTELKALNKNIFILTKGDEFIQRRKIMINNLHEFIPKPKQYIDLIKTPNHVKKIINDYNLDKTKTIMVGDSLVDDINSALESNIAACHIDSKDRHYSYDISDIKPTYTMSHVKEIRSILI